MTVLPDLVLAAIRKHQPSGSAPILLACSGGLDSQVLLHAAAMVWPPTSLWVAHVHHGLQPEADGWLDFCAAQARRLGLPFLSRRLRQLPQGLDGGIEAWARDLRYRAVAEMAAEAGAAIAMTAHHANDQLETYRLRSLRGSGPLGLGAMRSGAPLPGAPQCLLLRPFLDVERRHLLAYARAHRLDWVDDPSNQDLRYARNRIRKEIEQALLRDPASLARDLAAIGGFQDAADAARRQAGEDLACVRLRLEPQVSPAPLSRAALARLPAERAAEALRLWLAESGARMPSRAKLAELMRQLVRAGSSHARLRHDGRWLLRYRDRIDVVEVLPAEIAPTPFRWRGESLMTIGAQQFRFLRVSAQTRDSGRGASRGRSVGVAADWLSQADLLLGRARGIDRLRLESGGPSRSLKNLLQERGVPPWLRPALPVLRYRDTVLHAAPFGINQDLAGAGPGELIAIEWLAPAPWVRWL